MPDERETLDADDWRLTVEEELRAGAALVERVAELEERETEPDERDAEEPALRLAEEGAELLVLEPPRDCAETGAATNAAAAKAARESLTRFFISLWN